MITRLDRCVPLECRCASRDPHEGKNSTAPDLMTCGTCGRSWCARCHPTPAARCPYEYHHPEPATDDDAGRVFYTPGQIRAVDLTDEDIAMINGQWRELLDVWRDGDQSELEIENIDYARFIDKHLTGLDMYVVVRYVVEQPDSVEIEDSLIALRRYDLVTVQRPLPAR